MLSKCIFKTRHLLSGIMLLFALAYLGGNAWAQKQKIGPSGYPVPRFISLKSDRVNVRVGPGRDYDIAWTFVRARLPVEITQEYGDWRRIRDWEGKTGWIFKSLLTGYRSALITPWNKAPEKTPLLRRPGPNERIIAYLKPYVLAGVLGCQGGYCHVSGKDFEGWVDQTKLFGVYSDENFE